MFLSIMEYLPHTGLEIAATILSTIAVIIFIVAATLENKNKVILSQSIAHIFLIFSEAVSGAWSSIVQDSISLVRNVCVYFKKNTNIVNIILITLGAMVGIYANLFTDNFFTPWNGLKIGQWYGYLPVIANLEYSVVVLKKDIKVKWIKLAFAISSCLWGLTFVLTGKALILSGILNFITGLVALWSFISMCKSNNLNEKNISE